MRAAGVGAKVGAGSGVGGGVGGGIGGGVEGVRGGGVIEEEEREDKDEMGITQADAADFFSDAFPLSPHPLSPATLRLVQSQKPSSSSSSSSFFSSSSSFSSSSALQVLTEHVLYPARTVSCTYTARPVSYTYTQRHPIFILFIFSIMSFSYFSSFLHSP